MTNSKTGNEHTHYKAVLKAYGITHGMVAARLKVSYPYIANVLNGKAPLSWKIRAGLEKIVDGLLNPLPLDEALAGGAQ
jgi:hypothetical protein